MAFPSETAANATIELRVREIVTNHVRDVVKQKYTRLLAGEKPTHIGKAEELDRALELSDAVVSLWFDQASKKAKAK
jgi:hypothetical protein